MLLLLQLQVDIATVKIGRMCPEDVMGNDLIAQGQSDWTHNDAAYSFGLTGSICLRNSRRGAFEHKAISMPGSTIYAQMITHPDCGEPEGAWHPNNTS